MLRKTNLFIFSLINNNKQMMQSNTQLMKYTCKYFLLLLFRLILHKYKKHKTMDISNFSHLYDKAIDFAVDFGPKVLVQ